MTSKYEAVIGLEIHAELQTRSKMFCACPVVDPTVSEPNVAVCPVCTGMPGVLPVVNQRAVEFALRVALALDCEIATTSLFARKNYFYPDLPKGYQISQYEYPLARHGCLRIYTSQGAKDIRIRRVHLEEDTGKLTHVHDNGDSYSLVDINRAGVPLLEIVSEPDLHTAEEVRAYATGLRAVMRYLEVNSGDMEKGILRIEPNVSVRLIESETLGTRTEIKNLNSFRALERAVAFEIDRQSQLLDEGGRVVQETLGWDAKAGQTIPQRTKETEDDYRYFPEPDLPPLVIDSGWVETLRDALPELPAAKYDRFLKQYGLSSESVGVLVAERAVADYFEAAVAEAPDLPVKELAKWITGELFGLLNQAGVGIQDAGLSPEALVELIQWVGRGEINQNTGKSVLAEMFATGKSASQIISAKGLMQISDRVVLEEMVVKVMAENPDQVKIYLDGKTTISQWFFGQVMRATQGRANPQVVREILQQQLDSLQ